MQEMRGVLQMKYRKKAVVIEAAIYDGTLESIEPLNIPEIGRDFLSDKIYINTLEGEMKVSVGDYVIKGVMGEFYPCKPDIFKMTHEKV